MLPRAIALYLPQYHPIPENNLWWGPGFTEWTNTARARPLFRGHYQPHIPADLGYYDLRLEDSRIEQAELARAYGFHAFCYYHYWFGNGRRILQRPFDEVLASGRPDFPFCLAWANESWAGVWHGLNDQRVLVPQTYPGVDDHHRHFDALLPAFLDPRYVRVDNKPLFLIYKPLDLPDARRTTELWREMALRSGLPGLYLVCFHHDVSLDVRALGFDRMLHVPTIPKRRERTSWQQRLHTLLGRIDVHLQQPLKIPFVEVLDLVAPEPPAQAIPYIPSVLPNWDNTPRSQREGLVLHGSTPALFAPQVHKALARAQALPEGERMVFVKSWNEWAEGNHMEPDLRFGHGYLQAFREAWQRGADGPT